MECLTLPPEPLTQTGLPLLATSSARYADKEDRAIWTTGWACIGTIHSIPNPGDILPYTLGNQGIHVQHIGHGLLEARFNKAPHGGCRFVPLQCQTGTKTKCTFTSCGYSRDTKPMHESNEVATHQYLGLRPERLLRIPVVVSGSMIFVNLGEPAPDPEIAFAGTHFLNELWAEFPENWKELAARLFGHAQAIPEANRLAAILTHNGEQLALRWLFPNLLLLRAGASEAAIVLQPTALRQTLARISSFGAPRNWRETVKTLLAQETSPIAPASIFLRAMVTPRMEQAEP